MAPLLHRFTTLCLVALLTSGCDALTSLNADLAPTAVPTATLTPAPQPTATPTLGPREFMDTAFCALSDAEDGAFELLRFLEDGTVLDVNASPFANCEEAFAALRQHLTTENTMTFNHGQYHLSAGIVVFELAAPHSTTVVGEASGVIDGTRLTLTKRGNTIEYIQLNLGE